MNDREWDELRELWQSGSTRLEPVAVELERLARWRTWLVAEIVGEVLVALAGIAAGAWMISRGEAFFIAAGCATLVFVAAGMAFTAAMALASGLLAAAATRSGYVVIGIMQLALAAWLGLAFRYYRRRSGELAKLDAIVASLHD